MRWLDLITKFFDDSFASRWTGLCSGWTKELAISHVIADLLIWAAYMTIPILLIKIATKRKDIPFNILFFLFAIFIIGCGFTHLMGAITVFYPYYYIDLWIKFITAVVSIGTAWLLWKVHSRMISIPNPFRALEIIEKSINDLRIANQELEIVNKTNKQLEDFALVAAHDLQDPIKQNNVFVKLVKEGRSEFLDEIEINNARMNEFIKQLLTFARSGGVDLQIAKTDLNEVIKNIIGDLQEIIKNNNAQISVDELPTIRCDAIQMGRIFQNLIKNAIKYRSNKQPEIKITIEHVKGYWLFSVKDNGSGISPEQQPLVFTIYRGKKKDSTGAGFGLAICKRIVESHHGYIELKSEVGKGSCFHFSIKDNL